LNRFKSLEYHAEVERGICWAQSGRRVDLCTPWTGSDLLPLPAA